MDRLVDKFFPVSEEFVKQIEKFLKKDGKGMKKDKLTQKVISTRKRISAKKKKELKEKLKEAIRILTQEFKPERIFLIGSLAKDKVHYLSDIDLVVEGLGSDYLRAGGMLLDRLGEDIDLN